MPAECSSPARRDMHSRLGSPDLTASCWPPPLMLPATMLSAACRGPSVGRPLDSRPRAAGKPNHLSKIGLPAAAASTLDRLWLRPRRGLCPRVRGAHAHHTHTFPTHHHTLGIAPHTGVGPACCVRLWSSRIIWFILPKEVLKVIVPLPKLRGRRAWHGRSARPARSAWLGARDYILPFPPIYP